jgi:GT2 family glycosyltransferase
VPKVSVIIPHYQDLYRLDLCLGALEQQSYPATDFEIIVADNASPAGEAAVRAAVRGRAQLVIVQTKGAGPARNGGVAASVGETLAFIDCDCVADPAWLSQGILALQDYDFVGGRVEVTLEGEGAITGAEAFERVFAFNNRDYVERKGFTVTANLFCPRAVFDRVGGFRVGVSEDLDWSHRASEAGYRIGYAPDAIVGHPARRTWAELKAKWLRLGAESFGLAPKTMAGRVKWLLRSCLLPLSALVHTHRVLTSRKLVAPRDRVLALATLYRLRLWRFFHALRLLSATKV